MANKKINELAVKPSILTTDLIFVGDPSSGTLYRKTISDLSAMFTGTIGGSVSPTYIPKCGTTANTLTNSGISENSSGNLAYGGVNYTYKHNFWVGTDSYVSFTSISPFGFAWNQIVSHTGSGALRTQSFKAVNYIWFYGADVAGMSLSENGNFGIGTFDNGYRLDVSGTIRATGDIIAFSDARVKKDIRKIENPLSIVEKMNGVFYNRIEEEDQSRKIGFIAQDLIDILPEVVFKDKNEMLGVSYGNITALLVEAVKELVKKVNELENKK